MAELATRMTPIKSNSTTVNHDHFSTVSVDLGLNTTLSIVFTMLTILEL